jgi:MGT family glycosyltransferase
MTRILFTTNAMDGHVRPCLEVAQALVRDGHEVLWYTGRAYEQLIRNSGADFTPYDATLEFKTEGSKGGLLSLNKDLIDAFLSRIPGFMADLAAVFDRFEPEVVVAEHAFMAGPALAAQRGIARVVLSAGPLIVSSTDVAPFGTGLRPSATALGRLRNRALYWLVHGLLMRQAQQMAMRMSAEAGIPPLDGFFIDWAAQLADCLVQPSVPEFEYPRSDLPPTVQFTGITLLAALDDWAQPAWWPDIAAARAGCRPVVFVTQGTIATDPANLMLPAITALADSGMLVVVASGGHDPEQVIPTAKRPENVRIASFIPYTEVLPLADVMVTNGGYGGVQTALAHGVPLVVAGKSEDKQEANARVAWSGAGLSLRTDRPRPVRVANAVRRVLTEPAFRARAQEFKDTYARYPGAQGVADIIVKAASARRPTNASLGRDSAADG